MLMGMCCFTSPSGKTSSNSRSRQRDAVWYPGNIRKICGKAMASLGRWSTTRRVHRITDHLGKKPSPSSNDIDTARKVWQPAAYSKMAKSFCESEMWIVWFCQPTWKQTHVDNLGAFLRVVVPSNHPFGGTAMETPLKRPKLLEEGPTPPPREVFHTAKDVCFCVVISLPYHMNVIPTCYRSIAGIGIL